MAVADDPFERDGEGDQFDDLVLDDSFVRQAGMRELSAEDRARQVLQRERRAAVLADEARKRKRANRPHRRAARWLRVRRMAIAVVIVVGLVGGYLWSNGWGDGTSRSLQASDRSLATRLSSPDRPTPRAASSSTPLHQPPAITTSGRHLFEATQPGSAEPVAYDPCRVISVVINDREAPAGLGHIVTEALDEVSTLTGLQFHVDGTTDEPVIVDRKAFQLERYGDRWAPVLIGWTSPAAVPELAGDTIGLGGSSVVSGIDGESDVYVTGRVLLDAPELAEVAGTDNGEAVARSIVLHELAHLVGLGHVDDATQLMNPETNGDVVDFGGGDRAGLAQLGRGACIAEL